MKVKQIFLLVLAALFLAGGAACSPAEKTQTDRRDTKGKNTIEVYYQANDAIFTRALEIFRKKYKEINIDEKSFSNSDEYKNKLTMDILSGEGPDVIFLDCKVFGSINKLSEKGVLYDLNEYIKKDKDFKMSDYNEKILNSFEDNGKRFFIPIYYGPKMLITSKEALEANNIKINPSNWTYNELLRLVKEFAGKENNKNKYFFAYFDVIDLVEGSGITFVDFKKQRSYFETKDFINILEIYKELYPFICDIDAIKERPFEDQIKDNTYVMSALANSSPGFLLSQYSSFKNAGKEMNIYPFPVYKKRNIESTAYSGHAVAMCSQGKNKDAAYNFIKNFISEEAQTTIGGDVSVLGFTPVNKKACEDDWKYAVSEKAEGIFGASLPAKFKTQMDNILSKVGRCEMIEDEITKIIKEEVPSFIEGKKTAAQTAKAINDKVNLYLNE